MCSKAEWKECAERRLVENLALRTLIEQMDQKIVQYFRDQHRTPESLLVGLHQLVRTAKEVGK
jgi:hypothetical protein